jgi:hypothetical protein
MKLASITTIACLVLAGAGIVQAQDDETRKHLLHELGGPFIVYRSNVQEELKLSDDQKQRLLGKLPDFLQEAMKTERLQGAEREKEMRFIRQKSSEELWPFLQGTLNAEQFTRLQQLELQHEGPAAVVGRPEIGKELKMTDGQRDQVVAVVKDMQKRMEALQQQAHSGGDLQAIRLKAIKIYEDQEGKIEAILSEAQRHRWKEMRGKPFDVFDDR